MEISCSFKCIVRPLGLKWTHVTWRVKFGAKTLVEIEILCEKGEKFQLRRRFFEKREEKKKVFLMIAKWMKKVCWINCKKGKHSLRGLRWHACLIRRVNDWVRWTFNQAKFGAQDVTEFCMRRERKEWMNWTWMNFKRLHKVTWESLRAKFSRTFVSISFVSLKQFSFIAKGWN